MASASNIRKVVGGEVPDSPHGAVGGSLAVGNRHLATEQTHRTTQSEVLNGAKTANQRYLDKIFGTSGHHGQQLHMAHHGKGKL